MNTNLADICAYCGAPSPETRDHIPPRGVFPSPRPGDLITVPSCRPCNQGASARDERFLAYLSIQVGIDTPVTTRLWDQVLPGIRRNRRLHQHLREEVARYPLSLPPPLGTRSVKRAREGTIRHGLPSGAR
jgi:hypothetical protein